MGRDPPVPGAHVAYTPAAARDPGEGAHAAGPPWDCGPPG